MFYISIALIGVLFFVACDAEGVSKRNSKKERSIKQVSVKKEEVKRDSTVSGLEGVVRYSEVRRVFFKRNGRLEKGATMLLEGTSIEANELVCKLNFSELFGELIALKKALKLFLTELLEAKSFDNEGQVERWRTFLGQLSPVSRLPPLPESGTKGEIEALERSQLLQRCLAIERVERDIRDFLYVAPFSGILIDVEKHVGDSVAVGETVANLVKPYRFSVDFSMNEREFSVLSSSLKRSKRCMLENKSHKLQFSAYFGQVRKMRGRRIVSCHFYSKKAERLNGLVVVLLDDAK